MWNKNTYLYYWEYTPLKKDVIGQMAEERPMVSPWSRALHGTDIGFVFGTVGLRYGKNLSGDEAELSWKLVEQTQAAWYNFARTGNPNNPLIPEWKTFSADDRETMVIRPDATWKCEKDYRAAAMKILSVLRPYGENPNTLKGKATF
ncbi:MAG: carboxylesterase family protein [Desulfobacteraceae bacterium]|jgi:carboxylesterase type B